MRFFFSIKVKILCVIVAVFALQMVYSCSSLIDTYKEYRRMRIKECLLAFNAECRIFTGDMFLLQQAAAYFAQTMEMRQSQPEDARVDVAVPLQRVLEDFPAALGGGLWFEPYQDDPRKERSCRYLFWKGGKLRLDPSFETLGYNYPEQEWYRLIKERAHSSKDVVWSPPYRDASGTHALMITVGCGLFRHGELFGAVTIDWQLSDILQRISSLPPTKGSYVLFVDLLNDAVLARSDKPVEEVPGTSVLSLPWFPLIGAGQTRFTYDGVRYLSFMSTMTNNMALILNIPEDELMAPVRRRIVLMLAWMAGFSLLLFGATYYLLHRFVSAPMVSIVRQARRIGRGDLDCRVTVTDRGELGEVAGVLNSMTEDLKKHIGQMRRMVQEKERIAAELDVATHIQASMLPCLFPPYPNCAEFDLFAGMRPAREVGGDFYDFFMIDDRQLAFIIADVSGKGVPAALFMVIAKTLLKNHLQSGLSPAEALEATNAQLCENNTMDMFVTVWVGVLSRYGGDVRYANAGHNNPLLCRCGGAYKELQGRHGFVLGGMEGMRYRNEAFRMQPGDRILLYTDGVTETTNADGVMFGVERLRKHAGQLKEASLRTEVSEVFNAVDSFAGDAPQFDDITLLVLEYRGSQQDSAGTGGFHAACPALLERFEGLRTRVEGFLAAEGIGGKAKGHLLLVFEEVFVNITHYAYPEGAGDVFVDMEIREEGAAGQQGGRSLVCQFRDRGIPFDPLRSMEPDVSLPAEERAIGGLGLLMIRKLMDSVAYAREGDENVLVLTKKIQPCPHDVE